MPPQHVSDKNQNAVKPEGEAATSFLTPAGVRLLWSIIPRDLTPSLGEITPTPLSEVVSHNKPLDLRLLELARVLAK